MKKRSVILKKILLIATVLFDIALSVSVLFLMNHVQNLLNSDVKINLMEIVTQNKDVISSKLKLEMNNLLIVSDKISEGLKQKDTVEQSDLKFLIQEYAGENEKASLAVAGTDGVAFLANGTELDIGGRKYYRLASEGIQNISDKVISRIDGNEIFVISVPFYRDGKVIGTIQKSYTHDDMYNLCSISLFSSQGYMYIINSEGYVLLHTAHDDCIQKSDNYFRDLYQDGNREASDQLKRDLKDHQAGFMETQTNEKMIFSAYTPIEQIHDWYLITSVPNDAVSPNGNLVITIFYLILFVMLLIFTSCLLYVAFTKNKQKKALERIAFEDSVTFGNTYSRFILDVQAMLKNYPEKRYYILKFDIDNFKYINNFYGFDYGDKILRELYQSVNNRLGPGERLARISGDQFVALLEDAEESRLNNILEFSQMDEKISIYFSAGLYPIEQGNENVNLMVDKAGMAVRTVKDALTKKVGVYSKEFDLTIMHNEELKRAVNQALNKNEFEPFYQPKVDIISGDVVGAEALVRWRTEENKLIPPGVFIPMCEKTGLVLEIDQLILERVLQFLRKQINAGITCMPISVNFSRLHLLDDAFLKRILEKVEKYQVPPHLVEIELTESAIFDNIDTIYSFTEKLHQIGFTIAMDDFGSGYSSLNMLKDIPIDTLKIDKGFLSGSTNSDRRKIIISTVVQMADRMGISVVVEGVEYQENVELMKECGCSIAQGYYYAKPMEEAAFEKIFRGKRI